MHTPELLGEGNVVSSTKYRGVMWFMYPRMPKSDTRRSRPPSTGAPRELRGQRQPLLLVGDRGADQVEAEVVAVSNLIERLTGVE